VLSKKFREVKLLKLKFWRKPTSDERVAKRLKELRRVNHRVTKRMEDLHLNPKEKEMSQEEFCIFMLELFGRKRARARRKKQKTLLGAKYEQTSKNNACSGVKFDLRFCND